MEDLKEMKANSCRIAAAILMALCSLALGAQPNSRSQQAADVAIERWPPQDASRFLLDPRAQSGFDLLLTAMTEEWLGTANATYFRYAQSSVDSVLSQDGTIEDHSADSAGASNFGPGRELLLLYRVTRQPKYFKAASLLRQQLISQFHNGDGGASLNVHGPPELDAEDLDRIEPFLAEYASVFKQPDDFPAIAREFALYHRVAHDAKTGLLRAHAIQEGTAVSQKSATSAEEELSNTAWFLMALVDALPYIEPNDPARAQLLALLHSTAEAAMRALKEQPEVANKAQGVGLKGDPESSSPRWMISYALLKAVRRNDLPQSNAAEARRIYEAAASNPAQSTPAATGAFVLASREMEIAPLARQGLGSKAVVDAWFNSQQRKDALGQAEYFHYKWDDYSDSGFSLFGHLWNDYGFETDNLYEAPTRTNLAGARFYIIVSPDNTAKNPTPHYVSEQDAEQVAAWVKQGGMLLMMENDPANADIEHLDLLADKFGIHFNSVLSHHVDGDTFPMGRIDVTQKSDLFEQPRVLFMKDTCTISLSRGAKPLLIDKGDVMMATARYGKGTVFAVVDPWLYNEYTDGRKLPPDYENFAGARDLLQWLLRQPPVEASVRDR
jgi:unsaturated rhamnogalacturonyl hydrolase